VVLALSAQNERLAAQVESLMARVARQEARIAEPERPSTSAPRISDRMGRVVERVAIQPPDSAQGDAGGLGELLLAESAAMRFCVNRLRPDRDRRKLLDDTTPAP
jgi:hypothetical protein